jgi:hypothetical protein
VRAPNAARALAVGRTERHLRVREYRAGNDREHRLGVLAWRSPCIRQFRINDAYSIGCVFVCGLKAAWNMGFSLESDRVGRVCWGLGK